MGSGPDEELYPLPKPYCPEEEELARMIILAAVEKVERLGFTVLVGTRNGRVLKTQLQDKTLFLYHPDKH